MKNKELDFSCLFDFWHDPSSAIYRFRLELESKAGLHALENKKVKKMNWKKVLRWSVLLVVALVILMSVIKLGSTQEYYQFQRSFSSLPPGQTIWLSDGIEMRRENVFLWVLKEKGISRPYLLLVNTCTRIPYELTSVHDNSVAQTEVIICNIMGEMYYRVPITS